MARQAAGGKIHKMDNRQRTQAIWLSGAIIAASIPILLLILGIIAALGWTIRTDPVTGVTDTTVENAVFLGGLYAALPCGVADVMAGAFARTKGSVNKKLALAGIMIGVLGILLGLLAWGFFIMMSSFTF
jgi:hypothetical protein